QPAQDPPTHSQEISSVEEAPPELTPQAPVKPPRAKPKPPRQPIEPEPIRNRAPQPELPLQSEAEIEPQELETEFDSQEEFQEPQVEQPQQRAPVTPEEDPFEAKRKSRKRSRPQSNKLMWGGLVAGVGIAFYLIPPFFSGEEGPSHSSSVQT